MKILISNTDNKTAQDVKQIINSCQCDLDFSIIEFGRQCLDVIKNFIFHNVMILGINTADMSAFNLIGKIRDDFDALILVISNSNDELALVKALSLGADKYIVKPFNKRMFMAFVKAVYRKYKGLHWPKGHSTLSALF